MSAAVAGVVSGAPSTLWALLRGTDPLEPVRAAGSMLAPAAGPVGLLVAGGLVHGVVSAFWAAALTVLLPRRELLGGSVAGLAIAGLDLGVIAPRVFPRVAALELGPQVADHLAFGTVVGLVLRVRRRRRSRAVTTW